MAEPGGSLPPDDDERYRLEAVGAFAHEMRTPLTSIRMVVALGQRLGETGVVALDEELERMLLSAVDDLQHLADDLQETSRIERGKLALEPGPCDLAAALTSAGAHLRAPVRLDVSGVDGVRGPWDPGRLPRALAGFTESVNRAGNGSGVASLAVSARGDAVDLAFSSGTPAGEPRRLGSEAGYAFFRARQLVLAMGGAVACERTDGHCRMTVTLPLA